MKAARFGAARRLVAAVAVAVASVAGLAGIQGAAAVERPLANTAGPLGAVSPRVCEAGGTIYNTSQVVKYIGDPSTRVYGQPGGTLSIAKGVATTVSGSLQTTVSAEAGVIFAKASASVGVTIGLSKTVTVTQTYSWLVPANQNPGWLELGSAGYQISWTKGIYRSPCTWVQTGSGSILGATSNLYFIHS